MRTTLTRTEYDSAVRDAFNGLRATVRGLDSLPDQYPKGRADATRELNYRGVYVGGDFAERPWTADELDRVTEALELNDQLTADARRAQAAGTSLAAWRATNNVDA